MLLSDVQKAALNRLQSFYEGDNPYNSVTNPGGFRQNGHLYNFVPALKDIATVITGVAALAVEVATNSAQSPKALRVDADQNYTDAEKARGQTNLGIAATLATAVSKLGDTMKGALVLAYTNPNITLVNKDGGAYDGYKWNILHYGPDGCYYLQAVDGAGAGSNALQVRRDGSLITSQFGDLNARIEARCTAYATQRVAKAGDVMTGNLTLAFDSPYLSLQGKTGVHLQLDQRTGGGEQWNVHASTNRNFYIYRPTPSEGGAADYAFVMGPGGAISTAQLGDLNNRIEARGLAYQQAAQAGAFASAQATFVAKTGDTMSGTLISPGFALTKGNPNTGITVNSRETGNKDFTIYNAGNLFRLYETAAGDLWRLGTAGDVWTLQLGDLNARIEARGLAYQNVAIAASVNKASGTRQDISADFLVSKTYPALGMNYPNVQYNAWQIRDNGYTYLWNMSSQSGILWIGPGGDLITLQLGDINGRIEARAKAYADIAQNAAVSYVAWAFIADAYNSAALGGGMYEPYGGSAITGRLTYTESDGTWNVGAVRFRQLQYQIPSVGRVASFYG